jgi:hypothetical protein
MQLVSSCCTCAELYKGPRKWRVLGRKRARGRLGRWGCFGVGGEEVGRVVDSKKGSDNKMTPSLLSYYFEEVSKMQLYFKRY